MQIYIIQARQRTHCCNSLEADSISLHITLSHTRVRLKAFLERMRLQIVA